MSGCWEGGILGLRGEGEGGGGGGRGSERVKGEGGEYMIGEVLGWEIGRGGEGGEDAVEVLGVVGGRMKRS